MRLTLMKSVPGMVKVKVLCVMEDKSLSSSQLFMECVGKGETLIRSFVDRHCYKAQAVMTSISLRSLSS